MFTKTSLALLFIGILGLPSLVNASDFHSAREDGLAGAGHAAPMGNDPIYLNPAYASYQPTYNFVFDYLWYNGGQTEPDGSSFFHGVNQNVSIQDGRSQLFQAGAGYTQTENAWMVHIGASKQLMQQLGVGVGTKYIHPNNGLPIVSDATVSVQGIVSDWFQTAVVFDNMFEPQPGELGMNREIILGTKINLMGILLFYIDPHYAPSLQNTAWGYEAAAELTMFKDFFFRGGIFLNSQIPFESARGNGYGFGMGVITPRFVLDFGVSNPQTPINATDYNSSITFYL